MFKSLAVFPPIFVADTKTISDYSFVAPSTIVSILTEFWDFSGEGEDQGEIIYKGEKLWVLIWLSSYNKKKQNPWYIWECYSQTCFEIYSKHLKGINYMFL